MRIFLDANVLISVINKEYPLFTYSSRILSLADHPKYEVYTSPVCLAITFYFAEKKHRNRLAREKIGLLSKNLFIASVTPVVVQKAISNSAINDFEDGLEYYAAQESRCTCIITEDRDDFYFSEIDVCSCEQFLHQYLAAGRR